MVGGLEVARHFLHVGPGGVDDDGAGRGGGALQGALGAAQDFHPLYVVEGAEDVVRPLHHAILVNIHGGRGAGFRVEEDAAVADGDIALVLANQLQAGSDPLQVFKTEDVQLLNALAVHHADGGRDLAQRLLALLRGDHDFLQEAVARLGAGCRGQGCGCGQRQAGDEAQRACSGRLCLCVRVRLCLCVRLCGFHGGSSPWP